MLTSLRGDIADSLYGLANRESFSETGNHRAARLKASAETLRWVEAYEGTPSPAEVADADEKQERLDEIDYLLTATDANGKRYTLAQLRKEIEAVLNR